MTGFSVKRTNHHQPRFSERFSRFPIVVQQTKENVRARPGPAAGAGLFSKEAESDPGFREDLELPQPPIRLRILSTTRNLPDSPVEKSARGRHSNCH